MRREVGRNGMVERVLGRRRRLATWGNEPSSFWAQVAHQILPATLTCKTHRDEKEECLVRELFLTTFMTRKPPGSKMREDKLGELLASQSG